MITINHQVKNFLGRHTIFRGEKTKEIWSDAVTDPVAVRYAWAQNPVCNLQNREHLPATPFRTDRWKGVTEGIAK